MSELAPALATALAAPRVLIFGAVAIDLPGHDLRLLDGAGFLTIDGENYVGRDPVYGTLKAIDGLVDGGEESATVTLTLLPPSDAAIATLSASDVQGSECRILVGVADMASGAVIGSYQLFIGDLDVPTIRWGANSRYLEYRVTSITERLFVTEEGRRLTAAFHQSIWPGELGFDFVTGVEEWVPWGQKLDQTAVTTRTNLPGVGQITTKRT